MRRRDERGAALPATVIMMGVIMMIASLVIDIGGDRVVRREMQSIADLVALDVVRNLDGRVAGAYPGFNASGPSGTLFASAKTESLGRQGGAYADPDSVTVRLAVTDRDTGAFVRWAGAGDVPNAVRVWTTGSSAFRLLPTTPEATELQRSALAMIGPPIACISVGATFADVDPQGALDTLLGKLVGVDRLTVLDPYGLASLDLEIPLLDLAAKLGVGSVSDILTANVSAHDFVLAISQVLPPHNANKPSPVSLLDAIVNGLPDTPGFKAADILSLDTGGGSAATLIINTFTLLQAVIMVSNQEHFVDLGNAVELPGLAHATIEAKIVEAPKIACGPVGATAHSAQIQVRLSGEVKVLSGLVASAKIDPLAITVADGTGTITDVKCSAGNMSVSVLAKSALAKLQLRVTTELLLKLTRLEIAAPDPAVSPSGASIGGTTSQTLSFSFPTDDLPPAQTAGTTFSSLGLSTLSPIKINVSGLPVGGLLDGIVKPLLVLIDPVVSSILRPVLAELGASLGTVRIQPTGQPSCNEAFLRD